MALGKGIEIGCKWGGYMVQVKVAIGTKCAAAHGATQNDFQYLVFE